MTFILSKEPQEKDIKPFVVVCEGMGDVTFIDRILKHLAITNCCVGCPSDATGGGQGIERIPEYLEGIQVITKGRNILSGVAVVADADRSRQEKFKMIRKAFERAGFPRPQSPFTVYMKQLRVGVYFIPGKNKSGTLEHLLLEAVFRKRPAWQRCINDFSLCARTGTKKWTPNQVAKMKLSALVSVTCQKNPWASSNTMWSSKGCPVQISSPIFNEIRQFLTEFTQ